MSDTTQEGVSQANNASGADNDVAATVTEPTGTQGGQAAEKAIEATDPRMAMMDRIAEEQEGAASQKEPGEGDDQESDASSNNQAASTENANDDGNAAAAPPERMLTVKINGVEQQLPESEVVKGFQAIQAANQKFQEAAKMRDDAQALAKLLSTHIQPSQQGAQSGQTAEKDEKNSSKSPSTEEVDVSALVDAIQYGDKEEAAAALKKVLDARKDGQAAQPAVDPAAIAQEAAVQARLDLEYRQALERVNNEFQDVNSDPILLQTAATHVLRLRAQDLVNMGYKAEDIGRLNPAQLQQAYRWEQARGRVRSDYEVFKEAGTLVRNWRDGLVKGASQTNQQQAADQTLAQRRDAKRAMPTQPQAAATRATAKPAPKEETASDAIAEARKARGF